MKCPGQDTRYWKPGDIFEVACPGCGRPVEFFKDEAARRCRGCGRMVANPRMDFGCAAYCQHAADCLGALGPELAAKRDDLLKDRLAVEVKRRLGADFRSISHGVRVARYAEEIARMEKASPAAILCAAFLHVISELPGSENEGEERALLERAGASDALTGRVMAIIDDFSSGRTGESTDGHIFSDAHLLAASEEAAAGRGDLAGRCLTDAGRRLAAVLPEGTKEDGTR